MSHLPISWLYINLARHIHLDVHLKALGIAPSEVGAVLSGLPLLAFPPNVSHGILAAIRGVRSDQIANVLGYQYGSEVVHRNNLVLM